MNLENLLKDFPHISLAQESENTEILEFYHRFNLAKDEDNVRYLRGDDFYAFLRERTESNLVFIMRDDNQKLQGVAVVSYRPGHINGRPTTVGYLGDLRVALNRKLIREWRRCFGTFLKYSPEMGETHHCRYYQTALIETNAYSKANLVNSKIPGVKYERLTGYHMINVLGYMPWAVKSKKVKIRYACEEDQGNLVSLLNQDHRNRLFGHDYTHEFPYRLKNWNDFGISNWLIAEDLDGKILAATYLWNPRKTKQVVIDRVPSIFKIIKLFISLIPGLKMRELPESHTPMEILYLGQLSTTTDLSRTETKNVLKNMILYLLREKHIRFNMLSYCDFDREEICRDINGLIKQTVPMGLYTVHSIEAGEIRDPLILPHDSPSPAFDMVCV